MFTGEQAVYLCPWAKWAGLSLFSLLLIIAMVQDFVCTTQASALVKPLRLGLFFVLVVVI